ncbi:aldo/keto reductase [Candidatus Bathyarchaeota archaeon]|nr:MAG: aldo/keto reductase [Candidatus Bathyarchaeota archaeon]
MPVVGLGTWGIGGEMGPDSSRDEAGIRALRLGLDLEMKFIDTAEMYGAGHSEEVVARALEGRRDRVFVASKVSPRHFAYNDVLDAAKRSLKRLGLKQMDLYQLHWPSSKIPIAETMRAMEKLVSDGLTRYIGVSNFSVEQMKEAQQSLSHEKIVSNQVEFSLVDRSVEARILPYCQKEGLTLIAYSPLGQGKIPRGRGSSFKVLDEIAAKLDKSRNQVALGWVLQHDSVVAIPKAADPEHVKENAEVADWKIDSEDYQRLAKAFS